LTKTILILCVGLSLIAVINNLLKRTRLYITDRSLQIVKISGRTCIALSDIRELLYKIQSNGQTNYLVKTVKRFYSLGDLHYCTEKRQILKKLAELTGLRWENTCKYFSRINN